MEIADILLYWGIPTAITGLLFWWLKRSIDKRDAKKEAREERIEKFMLISAQNGRAAVVLSEATAKAVQRIPDAHCNGDMKAALERAEKIQKDEQEFLLDLGIQNIFGSK